MSGFTHYRINYDEQIPEYGIHRSKINVSESGFLSRLQSNLNIEIISSNPEEIIFDIKGIDASIANALRRILLAEVPTIAIETVFITNNTSIIQDEVLAHRFGLIPIKGDAKKLEYLLPESSSNNNDDDDTGGPDSTNTLVFKFEVTCPQPASNLSLEEKKYFQYNAKSEHLKWMPQGDQESLFGVDGVGPVHEDIVLSSLKPGQCIELEAHAVKGVGKDHAKFSPVATASYRLLPEITVNTEKVTHELAHELKAMCPMQVFDIEDIGGGGGGGGGGVPTAVVSRPRDCTMCRACVRKEGWAERVQLRRVADHFIFSVETAGAIAPEEIVREGISVLRDKASTFLRYVNQAEAELA